MRDSRLPRGTLKRRDCSGGVGRPYACARVCVCVCVCNFVCLKVCVHVRCWVLGSNGTRHFCGSTPPHPSRFPNIPQVQLFIGLEGLQATTETIEVAKIATPGYPPMAATQHTVVHMHYVRHTHTLTHTYTLTHTHTHIPVYLPTHTHPPVHAQIAQ